MSITTTILPAAASFPELAAALAALGWLRMPDPTAPEPFIPGEPELAEWRRRDADGSAARLVYTFAPASGLRALAAELPAPGDRSYAEPLGALPQLRAPDAAALLASPDQRSCLRGIQAAALLRDPALLAPLNALLASPNPTLAREARAALAATLEQTLRDSATVLRAIDQARPAPAGKPSALDRAMWSAAGDPHARRQLLRRMLRDGNTERRAAEGVLSAALADADWELRVTAMLVAARMRASAVRPLIGRMPLPEGRAEGLDSTDLRVLKALRQAALDLLDGRTPPERSDVPLDSRTAIEAHILRCADGLPVAHAERAFLLTVALTLPLAPAAAPPALPPGLRERDGAYWLGEEAFVWVPPAPHWLGDDLPRRALRNPIRHVPARGFFIAARPLAGPDGGPLLAGWEAAQRLCAEQSQRLGAPLRLPTADEWEMAARGPDGRRFPWGNGLERSGVRAASPWGAHDMVGVVAQWCGGEGQPLLCGGPEQLRCSLRIAPPDGSTPAALRPVLDPPGG
ncbi:MAG TPA: SUMF1/EgtB/PvdO family nonheme iron enzyme [Roseiflexaceae bacterium]|nr:SUMF1/EgtB/PvdO family nonheme iron enzyme [Roseiflexaceae bacterium]